MLVTPFFLLATAAPRTIPANVRDAAGVSDLEAFFVEAPTAPDSATFVFTDLASELQTKTVVVAPPPPLRQRFTVKGGYFNSSEDEFNDGSNWIVSWIRPMSEHLASEVELGYLDVNGSSTGVDRDAWAITFMANARLTFPVGKKFEIYGGLGLGTFYYDASARVGGVKVSGDGFLFAGDGYFGASVQLGDRFSLGLEGKYYVTDDVSNLGGGLDGFAAMLTVGFDI
jgi:opacity protein-like surface antigen